jgi:uncharacterized protein (TIGR03435 family)
VILRGAATLAIALLVTLESRVEAQAVARPEFDAASIRPSDSRGRMAALLKPGSLGYTNYALADYVSLAYDIQPYQLTHASSVSLDDLSSRYDIVAKAGEAVPVSRVKLMLQSLLADRFKLTLHVETKELPAYILTVDKSGPRFQESQDEGPTAMSLKDGTAQYRRASMFYLTRMLSYQPSLGGRPVVDRTGLAGIYDLSLKLFDADAPPGDPGSNPHQQMDERKGEWLKALGLKLESQKASIEILVVDHVEKPSAN